MSTSIVVPNPADLDTLVSQMSQALGIIAANPQYYPWSLIPPDGKSFDPVMVIGTPTVGAGETIVARYTMPLGYDGIVIRINNNFLGASFNPGLPSLTWRIRNGTSITQSRFIEDYSNIVVEFGTTQIPRPISGIFLTSGQTLLYTVQNNDGTLPVAPSSQVCCGFSGFRWPQQRELQGQQ